MSEKYVSVSVIRELKESATGLTNEWLVKEAIKLVLDSLIAHAVESPDDKFREALERMVNLVDAAWEEGVRIHVPSFVRAVLRKEGS